MLCSSLFILLLKPDVSVISKSAKGKGRRERKGRGDALSSCVALCGGWVIRQRLLLAVVALLGATPTANR